MYVDLAHEHGNPRQVRVLTESLGAADAARLLRRLRAWSASADIDAVAGPLRPRTLARAAGWRGDPTLFVHALAQARLVQAGPGGVRLRPRPDALAAEMTGAKSGGAGVRARTPGPDARPPRRQPTVPAPVVWQAALRELAALVNRANYDAFLAGTEGLYRSGQWFTIGVPSSYALAALADRFRPALAWAVYVVSGERLGIRLVLAPPVGPLLHLPPRPGRERPDLPDPVPPPQTPPT